MTVQTTPRAAPFGAVFATVAAGVAMSNLDMFIVNVAMPELGARFSGASLESLSWILNGYAVVFAALLIPAGGYADRAGPRRAYLLGIAVFTAASALCALAPTVWLLVAARVVQAAGAALLLPASLGLLLAAAPAERRVGAVRAWTAIGGLAAALGPVVGGLLTELNWRWIFLVNVPVGLAVLVAGPRLLPAPAGGRRAARADLAGAVLLAGAAGALALGLVQGDSWGWTSAGTLGAFAATPVLFALFVRRSARHESPVVPAALLRIPLFGRAVLANLVFAVAFAAMLLGVVLWCEGAWGWSAVRTGFAVAPGPLMVPVFALTMAPVARRFGAGRLAAAGSAVFGAGVLWWLVRLDATPDYLTGLLPGMLLTGVGVGLALPTLVGAAVAALPPASFASFATGSAVVTMVRQFGAVLGVAALVATLGAEPDFGRAWPLVLAASALSVAACLTLTRPKTPVSG